MIFPQQSAITSACTRVRESDFLSLAGVCAGMVHKEKGHASEERAAPKTDIQQGHGSTPRDAGKSQSGQHGSSRDRVTVRPKNNGSRTTVHSKSNRAPFLLGNGSPGNGLVVDPAVVVRKHTCKSFSHTASLDVLVQDCRVKKAAGQ